jgi:hypothetical protein
MLRNKKVISIFVKKPPNRYVEPPQGGTLNKTPLWGGGLIKYELST